MLVQGFEIVEWIASETGFNIHSNMIGLGYIRNKKIIAGVAYERYTGKSITVHQRVIQHAPRGFWFASVDYMFNKLDCNHCIGLVDSTNQKAIKINLKMGFEIQSTLKDAGSDGSDLLIMVMTKENCRLLKWGR